VNRNARVAHRVSNAVVHTHWEKKLRLNAEELRKGASGGWPGSHLTTFKTFKGSSIHRLVGRRCPFSQFLPGEESVLSRLA